MSIRYLVESNGEFLMPDDGYTHDVNKAKVFDDLLSADCYAIERDHSVDGRQHVVHPYHVA